MNVLNFCAFSAFLAFLHHFPAPSPISSFLLGPITHVPNIVPQVTVVLFILLQCFFFLFFIYSAGLGLSCAGRSPIFIWHGRFLVVACELSCTCGIQFPD